MIKVKSFFNGWHEVEEEQAIRFFKSWNNGISCAAKFFPKHFRGISYEEMEKLANKE